jgi:ribosomal protein S18 acetylase RimI-like enzyme
VADVAAGAQAAGIRVRQATRADLDAVVALRLALLREHAGNPIYGRLRGDAARRARPIFAAQIDASTEATLLAVRPVADRGAATGEPAEAAPSLRSARARAERRPHHGARTPARAAAAEPPLEEVLGILRCIEAQGSPLLEPPRYGYIASVYVTPQARRHGVLHQLFDAACAWSEARGLGELRLHVAADNPTGNAAWAALGFTTAEHLCVRPLAPGAGRAGESR